MNEQSDVLDNLRGQVDALAHLCSILVALAPQSTASIVSRQIENCNNLVQGSNHLPSYISGYTSVTALISSSLKVAAEAATMRGMGHGDKH